MTLSTQEMSDRFEIQDLCCQYADIIDRQAFDELVEVFTEDAHIDYSETGGSTGNLSETIAFLKRAMPVFPHYQHLNANMQIKVKGDSGTGRIMCFNPMELQQGDGNTQLLMCGIWYVDEYVRTQAGWRIRRRGEEKCYMFLAPSSGQATQGQ